MTTRPAALPPIPGYLMLALNNQLATIDLFATVLVLSLLDITLLFLVGLAERLTIPASRNPPVAAAALT